jgi:hypothetical protein
MLMVLIVGFVPYIYSVNNPNPMNTFLVICKIRTYIGQSLAMMYRWLMTMACIDRYIISSRNFHLRKYTSSRNACSIIITIIIICLLLPMHNLIFFVIKRMGCVPSDLIYIVYYSTFTFIFGGFLPILIMTISVILIRSNLVSKQARRYHNVSHENSKLENRSLNERDDQIILMLYLQILVYIILNIPWMIYLLYSIYLYSKKNPTINEIIIRRIVHYLMEILVYMYPTLSFYIYTLTSKRFRNELSRLILTCGNRSKRNSQLGHQGQLEIPLTEKL